MKILKVLQIAEGIRGEIYQARGQVNWRVLVLDDPIKGGTSESVSAAVLEASRAGDSFFASKIRRDGR